MSFLEFPISDRPGSGGREIFLPIGGQGGAQDFKDVKVIDVSKPTPKPNVKRGDLFISDFVIDEGVLDDIIVRPTVDNKVISQSIPPGTVVAKGTEVDIVLAPPSNIPGGLIVGAHEFFFEQGVDTIYSDFIQGNQDVEDLVIRNPDPEKMSNADRTQLNAVAEEAGATIGTQPGQTTEDFLTTLQFAMTMIG